MTRWFVLGVCVASAWVAGCAAKATSTQDIVRGIERAQEARDLEFLVEMVVDPTQRDAHRELAARALSETGDARAVQALITAIEVTADHPNQDPRSTNFKERTRTKFAESLGGLGEPAVEPLKAMLESSNDEMRRCAAVALQKIDDPEVVDPLIVALQDPILSIRGAAAVALGNIGDQRALDALVAAMGDQNWNVREKAARALHDGLGWRPGNEDSEIAYLYAAREFGDLKDRGDPGIALLIEALTSDGFSLVRERAADALGNARSSEAVDALIRATADDESQSVRKAATIALVEIDDPRATDIYLAILERDPGEMDAEERELRPKAAMCLLQSDDPRARSARDLASSILEGESYVTLDGHNDQYGRENLLYLENMQGTTISRRWREFHDFNNRLTARETTISASGDTLLVTDFDGYGNPMNPRYLCIDLTGNIVWSGNEAVSVAAFQAEQVVRSRVRYVGLSRTVLGVTRTVLPCRNCVSVTKVDGCRFVW